MTLTVKIDEHWNQPIESTIGGDIMRTSKDLMGVCSRANVDMPESKDIDDETIQVWAESMTQN